MHEEIIACIGYSLHAFYVCAVADLSRLYIPAIDASPPHPRYFVCINKNKNWSLLSWLAGFNWGMHFNI